MTRKHIDECVRESLEAYFADLRGTEPANLHEMLIKAVEKPLLEVVMVTLTTTRAAPPTGWG